MHALQTSGNCIRNVTADQYAAAAADEIEDPRICAEVVRQWSSLHPEFSFLPRKFKVAVTGAPADRAAIAVHDIGIRIVRAEDGEIGYEVLVGGGQGRTPMIAKTIRDFLPKPFLLSYLEAILRVYYEYGRRDNMFKARIKILVHEIGVEEFRRRVEEEWEAIRGSAVELPEGEMQRIAAYFAPPPFAPLPIVSIDLEREKRADPAFARWARANLYPHKQPGYAIVNLSLKPIGGVPGDASAEQMDAIADLAERYSFGEIRVTHEQNLTLPHVRQDALYPLWRELGPLGLATANIGTVSDIIACPGLDYCSLANARAIPIAQGISERFGDIERAHRVGELKIKISGCINACGHHHVGHIGILGVDKKGEEFYQITLGGDATETAALGQLVGPAFAYDDVVDAVENLVETYLGLRQDGERFLDTYRRVGLEPFKEKLYAAH
jgi:sulfite reductase (NADPH) hemoprotein beta-component